MYACVYLYIAIIPNFCKRFEEKLFLDNMAIAIATVVTSGV